VGGAHLALAQGGQNSRGGPGSCPLEKI
jgi:hypothetical protein